MDLQEKLLEKQKALTGRKSLSFPLERLQVDQSSGVFTLGNGEEKQDLGDEVEVVFVKRYAEFIHFDPEKEKITLRSTIEESARECRELYSGTPIKQLKDSGFDMKFIAHYIVLINTLDGYIPADFQIKGAVANAVINLFSENRDLSRLTLGHFVKMRLKRKKKGAVKFYVPEFEVRKATNEELEEYLDLVDEPVEKFEEFRKEYNSRLKANHSEVLEEKEEDLPDF